MTRDTLLPHGEALRRAIRWLSDQGRHDASAIEEASQRFDLTPLEEDFLLAALSTPPGQRERRD